jgi:hypothetical protein
MPYQNGGIIRYFFFPPWYVMSYWKKLSQILLLLAVDGCLRGLVEGLATLISPWLANLCLLADALGGTGLLLLMCGRLRAADSWRLRTGR